MALRMAALGLIILQGLFAASFSNSKNPVNRNERGEGAKWSGIRARRWSEGECDFLEGVCNTVENKHPFVTPGVPSGPSIETGASLDTRAKLEILLGKALRNTSAVLYITNEFVGRITEVMQKAMARANGTHPDDVIQAAYGGTYGSPHNTGYVGPDLNALKYALSADGNIREKWALIYILTKNKYFDSTMVPAASMANKTGDLSPLEQLGVDANAVLERYRDVRATQDELPSDLKYSNGIPSFEYEPFDSWVRFTFDGPPGTWLGARKSRPEGCAERNLTSDDPSLSPPLSPYELRYQCGNASRCMLQWYPGELCYDLVNASFAEGVPGYLSRASALNYRTAAGPSGTTSNVLMFATLLGFEPGEMVLLRLAMMAWMTVTRDHSFYEIMLGGDSFMSPPFTMEQGMDDLRRLMPVDVKVGSKVFAAKDVWSAVGAALDTPAGRDICTALAQPSRTYLTQLTGTPC